jgi:hypothetical protein
MLYIRGNLVRHGLVKDFEDWPRSSLYHDVTSHNDATS